MADTDELHWGNVHTLLNQTSTRLLIADSLTIFGWAQG